MEITDPSNALDVSSKLEDLKYLYASNVNVSNFVSVKLSDKDDYRLWKAQMLCLMESHKMRGLIDDEFVGPTHPSREIMESYDNLLKGWIFGSLNKEVLRVVVDLDSATAVWMKLKSTFELTDSTGSTSGSTVCMEIADPSNALDVSPKLEDLKYLYASNVNVSNFVSVKLSGNDKYRLWKTQMLCLMESHNMRGIINDNFVGPRHVSQENTRPYESLLKGWIFSSLSEEVLGTVVGLGTVKEIWERLKSIFDPTGASELEAKPPKPPVPSLIESIHTSTDFVGTDDEKTKLCEAAKKGMWNEAEDILKKNQDATTMAIDNDRNTVLHIAVLKYQNDFVKNVLKFIKDEKTLASQKTLRSKNKDGRTPLHMAAMFGNKRGAELLVEENDNLLGISDRESKIPLLVAYDKMELRTFAYLLKAANEKTKKAGCDNEKSKSQPLPRDPSPPEDPSPPMHHQIGVNLLVNVISAKRYDFASQLVETYPNILDVETDEVLMAIAKNFPSGLDFWELFIYPSLQDLCDKVCMRTCLVFVSLYILYEGARLIVGKMKSPGATGCRCLLLEMNMIMFMILLVLAVVLFWIYGVVRLLLTMLFIPFFLLYFLLWKVTATIVAPIKRIEKKKNEHIQAQNILETVCDKFSKSKANGTHHTMYNRPILEAACQDACEVVDMILSKSPEALGFKNESGHDIIQLAVIHRSEKTYNIIYQKDGLINHYRTIVDSLQNNLLHLAGRMAPSHKLNRRIGAALQLQHELQWREEVKRFVYPSCITEENIFKETPNMVFTKEHKNLVKEGEQWMKTTAESCTITATLITTIAFAAAITVPGGNDQETGIPLFTTDIAFNIFAISNAISLFASTTAVLMFLSILTARFAEKDFLVSLPRRLIIGLCCLFLSTTSMMVAFSAILFLVFCNRRTWILAPVIGFACLPITLFVTLQFPIVVDLLLSTYFRDVVKKETRGKFEKEIRGEFENETCGKIDPWVTVSYFLNKLA